MKQKHWQVSVFDKTSETIRDDTFYTTDTEAYLVFELIDEDFTPDSATVTVYNIYGKATINASVEIADGIVRYEIPVDAIGHPGGWRTQVIFTEDNEDYTTKIIEFDVGGHLLDNKKPAIVDIENWNSFIAHAEELIDDWERLEEIRQANETSRQTNELVREEAENNRQSTFETNEAERQNEFETNEDERESTFEINESARQENELARESAESVRVANEEERQQFYESLVLDNMVTKDTFESNADIQLTNLIVNGDFSEGAKGWIQNAYNSTFEVIDGVAKATDFEYRLRGFIQNVSDRVIAGNFYYATIRTKVEHVEKFQNFSILSSSTAAGNFMLKQCTNLTDEFDRYSGYGQWGSGRHFRVIYNFEEQGEFPAYLDDVLLIDLTKTFGAGNEPTKEEMDVLIDIIGWFDGKITLTQKQQLIWTLNLIRKNRNAITALGGGIV